MKLSTNTTYDTESNTFIHNGNIYPLESVEKIFDGWAKFRDNKRTWKRTGKSTGKNEKYISRLLKFAGQRKNLHHMYTVSRVGIELKRQYNQQMKKAGKKYTIKKFLSFLRKNFDIELYIGDDRIYNTNQHTDIKGIDVIIVGEKSEEKK